jgi:hypothetical protein
LSSEEQPEYNITEQTAKINRENWPEVMLDLYSEGCSDSAVCSKMKILRRTFDKHYRDDARFRDLVDQGREYAMAWWEEQGRLNLTNKLFNANLYKLRMQKYYGYSSKVETTSKTSDKDIEKLKQELLESLPTIQKMIAKEETSE